MWVCMCLMVYPVLHMVCFHVLLKSEWRHWLSVDIYISQPLSLRYVNNILITGWHIYAKTLLALLQLTTTIRQLITQELSKHNDN
jgi:hypothetical protein